jgi:hypothetical protein
MEPGLNGSSRKARLQTVTIGHVLLLIDFVGTWKFARNQLV